MIITIPVQGRTLAIMAPLGAAAYISSEAPNILKVLFAMMRKEKDESAIDTINWLLSEAKALEWKPVSGRPEHQRLSTYSDDGFIEYQFINVNGEWQPASADLTSFLQMTGSFRALPASPPSSLRSSITLFSSVQLPGSKRGK